MLNRALKCIGVTTIALLTYFSGEMTAAGDTIKFCFQGEAYFTDNGYVEGGVSEDYWPTDQYRPLGGAKVKVVSGGVTRFDGNVGDGIGTGDPGEGCTPTLTVPSANTQYTFYHYSTLAKTAAANGGTHTLNVRHVPLSGFNDQHAHNVVMTVTHTGGIGTFNINFIAAEEIDTTMRLQAAAAHVLKRIATVATSSTFHVFWDETEDLSRYDDGVVFMTTDGTTEKFLIGHELGHALADCYGHAVGGNCGYNDSQCGSVGHHMGSKEYQTCAFTEGIANFFAAVSWNFIGESDCIYGYNFSAINCEGSQSNWPVKYMETECYNTSFTDKGVEIDWLRQFWDVRTNGGGISMTVMADWLISGWSQVPFGAWVDPYAQLDASANSEGGTLNSNWDGAKGANGIDW